jgi:hypothetical protein
MPLNLFYRISIVANILLLLSCLVVSLLGERAGVDSNLKHTLRYLYSGICSSIELLNAGLLAYLGHKFSDLFSEDHVNREILPRSEKEFYLMNVLLALILCVRSGLTVIVTCGVTGLPSDSQFTHSMKSRTPTTIAELAYFLILEIFPCYCVLVTLWLPLIQKEDTKIKTGSGQNSEMDARFNDMFSPQRSSQISRDGDSVVRVVFAPFVAAEQSISGSTLFPELDESNPSGSREMSIVVEGKGGGAGIARTPESIHRPSVQYPARSVTQLSPSDPRSLHSSEILPFIENLARS